MPSTTKLREVLDYLKALLPDQNMDFFETLIGTDFLDKGVVEVCFENGKSLGLLESEVSESNDLNACSLNEMILYRRFLGECAKWSDKRHKRPRIEEPHERFASLGTPTKYARIDGEDSWPEKQKDPDLVVMCGRPSSTCWINVRIMHPVFNEMLACLKENSVPAPEDYTLARVLTHTMPSNYENEGDRQNAINDTFNEHLQLGLEPRNIQGFMTDGPSLRCGIHVAFKNEKGLGGTDPYMQNIGYYVQYWSAEDGPTRHCCPWIIMEVLGQEIGLSAIVWAGGHPTAQPLTPNIPFIPVPCDKDVFTMQARWCKALRVGTTQLCNFYGNAESLPKTLQADLPYPRKVEINGEEVQLEYTGVLPGAKEARKMLFLATRKDTEESVLVKFTDSSYGEEVHRVLAEAKLAPALYYVGRETGLVMVAMEFVRDSRMWNDECKRNKELIRELQRVGDVLAAKGYVHGDLRPPNVHVKGGKVYILDFDFAGKANQVVYPDLLNPFEYHNWPEDPQVGMPITTEIDQFMIKRLCKP